MWGVVGQGWGAGGLGGLGVRGWVGWGFGCWDMLVLGGWCLWFGFVGFKVCAMCWVVHRCWDVLGTLHTMPYLNEWP